MSSGARLDGKAAMQARLKRLKEKLPDEVGRALYMETEVEATEVKRRTPVDRGDLRASVHVIGPVREGRMIYCLIVAGGVTASYAWIVHEDLEAFHKVGQAKYIESVILESRSHMGERVARRIELNKLVE
jgi:hypothetical protein